MEVADAPPTFKVFKMFDNCGFDSAGWTRALNQLTRESMATDVTPPSTTLPRMLQQAVATYPDRTALLYFDSRITFGQLLEQVNRVAAGLQALGIKKGDRVALMMPNCPQF